MHENVPFSLVKKIDIPTIIARAANKAMAIKIMTMMFLLWCFFFSDLREIVENDCRVDEPPKLDIQWDP